MKPSDTKKVGQQLSEYATAPGLSGVKLTLVDSVAEAEKLMSWLGQSREILAIDTENFWVK